MEKRIKNSFLRGTADGIPIALGYLSVSFGFGIMAAGAGLSVFEAFMISLTNLTSAGQAQGVAVIAGGGTLLEMAAVQLIINIRYALMAISLSQKLDKSFTLPHRMMAAYGITDEIFAVCSTKEKSILAVVVIAAGLSILCKYLLIAVSSGFAVILCALAASLVGAALFPRKEEED